MTNFRSLKSKKTQKAEPSLLDELRGPLRDVVIELKSNLAGELQKVREHGESSRYLEAAAKLLPLIMAFNMGGGVYSSADSMEELGIALLNEIGFAAPDENSIQQAIQANDQFFNTLKTIKARAEGAMQ